MIEVAHRVATEKPFTFTLENSRLLLAKRGARLLRQVLDIIIPAAYVVHTAVLNSAEHGALPHARRRSFIVGIHDDVPCREFTFPSRVPCMAPSELLAPQSERDDPNSRPTASVARQAMDSA